MKGFLHIQPERKPPLGAEGEERVVAESSRNVLILR